MIHIVLVEPEIPQNTGNISRTCAATGCALHLVKPLGFSIDEKAVRRAGLDYWKYLNLTVHESFEAFLKSEEGKGKFYYCTTKGKQIYSEADFTADEEIYLLFGRETRGLPERILKQHPEDCIRIPMINDARSLNLSNSVAIVAYEALRQLGFDNMKTQGELTGRID